MGNILAKWEGNLVLFLCFWKEYWGSSKKHQSIWRVLLQAGEKWNGLPWRLSGKESAYQCRKRRFSPWVGTIPWRTWHTRSSFLAYEIPWTEGLGVQSMGSQKSQPWLSDQTTTRKNGIGWLVWSKDPMIRGVWAGTGDLPIRNGGARDSCLE